MSSGFDPASPVHSAQLAALFAHRAAPVWVAEPVAVDVPDPDAIAEDAWARGQAAGLAAARAELVPVQELLDAAVVALRRAGDIDAAALRTPFAELVARLCGAVIAAELRLAPEHVLALIDPALAAITCDVEPVLRLHPLDAELIEDVAALPLPLVPDAAVARGSVLVEAPHFVIADSFGARLAAVLETLPCC
ncbi:MAG TPA: FliH/SctL family protein [Polymorphobacter sp.]|nr:FliH/SctL family protein [Polymorphobacter sp.]